MEKQNVYNLKHSLQEIAKDLEKEGKNKMALKVKIFYDELLEVFNCNNKTPIL